MTIYVPVSVEDRVPEDYKKVFAIGTNGRIYIGYFISDKLLKKSQFISMDTGLSIPINYWLEKQTVPDAVEVFKASQSYTDYEPEQIGFRDGANHIINIIKGKK